jgi:Protein of unknown function (DUF3297)
LREVRVTQRCTSITDTDDCRFAPGASERPSAIIAANDAEEDPMTEPTDPTSTAAPPPLPDRLSTDPRSPHYVAALMERDIGIRFNDTERFDVEEYCISEGWVKVAAGKTLDRRGQPLLIKLKGKVEAYYR